MFRAGVRGTEEGREVVSAAPVIHPGLVEALWDWEDLWGEGDG